MIRVAPLWGPSPLRLPDHLKAQGQTLGLLNARDTGKCEAQPTFGPECRLIAAFQTQRQTVLKDRL